VQDVLDCVDHLAQLFLGRRRVGDVQHEVGHERLLEGRGEAFHELVRQPADEPDGVGHEIAAAVLLEAPRRRVERLEEPVADGDVRAGERVQQGRLADVRVAGERDRRLLRAAPLLPAHLALATQLVQPPLEQRHAPPRQPPVGLELRLARAPRPDAAAEPLEVLPHPPHAREVVLELRQLDLQLPLGRTRVLGEDVEDQLRPVDDARLEGVLEGALLRRRQLVVDHEHLRARGGVGLLQLGELPLADVRPRIGAAALLRQFRDGLDPGR
jgi:hypothetical protein